MTFRKRTLAPLIVAATTLVAAAGITSAATAQAATTTLCNGQTTAVAGGAYNVQNNEWNSSAPECITTDGNADFTVANSSINQLGGGPGGYPSIYKGCHWGGCTSNSGLPVQVGAITPGKVTTSWNTTQTYTGSYDVAYDIWFNHTATTSGQPNAEEMMIWLNHNGPVGPAGSVAASNVSIGGRTYNVWVAQMSSWVDVSYVMTSGTTSVSNLDLAPLVADSESRGILSSSDYLIDLEAGFELWQGGAGLATNSYSVNIGGSGTSSTGEVHAVGAGKCLDDPNFSNAPATQQDIWDCNGGANQTWTYTSAHQLTLTVNGSTFCLDAAGQGTSPGTKADIWPCNGQANQQWTVNSNGTITGVQSGLCLDVTGASTADGALVDLWTCNGQSNQHWTLG
jgi:hypothetical protein